ncbi:hypothetical protein [Halarcobacter sp.]|uniref:hypothetical protein n=1 Tax=Halarcobacter sp. TaxID=2321133 RepID=UPI0029F4A6B1|nr:hypothetical protein [Halarcobacter sp.]
MNYKLKCGTVIRDDFGSDLIKDVDAVLNHYNYDFTNDEKKDFKEYINENVIISKGLNFVRGIEIIMFRINIINLQIEKLHNNEGNTNLHRTSKLNSEIHLLTKMIDYVKNYSDCKSKESQNLIKGLNRCLSELGYIKRNIKTRKLNSTGLNQNIHYSHGFNISILNKRVEYFKTSEKYYTEMMNNEIIHLCKDLENLKIDYNKNNLIQFIDDFFF